MTQANTALAKLIMQYQTASRTLPTPAAGKVLPFDGFNIGRDPRRQKNATITSSPLANKTDKGSQIVPPTALTSILDLRSVGYLLKLLLGQPVSTGTGLMTHTFPFDLADRPYALMEMQHPDIGKFFRFLDCHCNKLSWDIKNNDQLITAEILAGIEIDPIPTAAFDAAPTSVAQFRANSGSGVISDGSGTTLGQVVGGNIEIDCTMQPQELANGVEGYSVFPVSEVVLKGKLKAVFDGVSAYDMARTGTSTRLKIVSAATIGANTFSLTVDMPYVELVEKAIPRKGRTAMFVDLDWMAHAGATLPTITLQNDVASY